MMHVTRPYYLDQEVPTTKRRLLFERRMAGGCLLCSTKGAGKVCPDCYHCVKCGPGCSHCKQYRKGRCQPTRPIA